MPRKDDLLGPLETIAQERLSPDEIAGWAGYPETEDDDPATDESTPDNEDAHQSRTQEGEPERPESGN